MYGLLELKIVNFDQKCSLLTLFEERSTFNVAVKTNIHTKVIKGISEEIEKPTTKFPGKLHAVLE